MLDIKLCLWPSLTQVNLGKIHLSGTVLESSGWADSKTVPGFDKWPRFVGVIEQNKISNSLCHYCKAKGIKQNTYLQHQTLNTNVMFMNLFMLWCTIFSVYPMWTHCIGGIAGSYWCLIKLNCFFQIIEIQWQ